MNIFSSLSEYDPKVKHEKYLRERGITEEEFLKERELKRQKEHQEYLEKEGITEEEYQKRQKKIHRKEKFKEAKEKITSFLMLFGFFAFLLAMCSRDARESIEPILIVCGFIFLGVIFFMMCVPVYLIICEYLENSENKSYIKVIAVILTLIIMAIIVYTCESSSNYVDNFEFSKLHPD